GGEVLSSGSPDFLARHLRECVVQSGMPPSWRFMNTDYMYFSESGPVEFSNLNIPRIGDVAFDAVRYVDQIVAGFEDAYRVLVAHRGELLSERGPLVAFEHQATRFVLRNTRLYRMLIDQSPQPKYLRSESVFTEYFDSLIRKLPAQTYGWSPEKVWKTEM